MVENAPAKTFQGYPRCFYSPLVQLQLPGLCPRHQLCMPFSSTGIPPPSSHSSVSTALACNRSSFTTGLGLFTSSLHYHRASARLLRSSRLIYTLSASPAAVSPQVLLPPQNCPRFPLLSPQICSPHSAHYLAISTVSIACPSFAQSFHSPSRHLDQKREREREKERVRETSGSGERKEANGAYFLRL